MKTKFFLILFLLSVTLYSQERVDESTLKINNQTETNVDTTTIDNPVGLTSYLRVIFVLIFVIALLYIALKYIKKIGQSRIGMDNDLIHVISTKVLKGTNALHLVEVGNQVFLVGATDRNINQISEITDQETKDMIKLNLSVDNMENKSFFQQFTEKLQKFNINTDSGNSNEKPDLKTNKEKLERF